MHSVLVVNVPVLTSLCGRTGYVHRPHTPICWFCLWQLTRIRDPWSYGSHLLPSSSHAPLTCALTLCLVVLAGRLLPGGPSVYHTAHLRPPPSGSLVLLASWSSLVRPSASIQWSPGLGPRSSCSASPQRWACLRMLPSWPGPGPIVTTTVVSSARRPCGPSGPICCYHEVRHSSGVSFS